MDPTFYSQKLEYLQRISFLCREAHQYALRLEALERSAPNPNMEDILLIEEDINALYNDVEDLKDAVNPLVLNAIRANHG
jgi:hypothetical protein